MRIDCIQTLKPLFGIVQPEVLEKVNLLRNTE